MISNGIKYQDSERPDSYIKIDIKKEAKFWQLIVEDNGQGIPDDQQRNIFDMFHRATEDSDGSGLGLFIVHEAVDRLGGTISVKSSVKQGSIFELEFPYMENS